MAVVSTSLECRLLCASNCAYAIHASGPLSQTQPYSDAVGFTNIPMAFVAGKDSIHACLVGTNQDGVILAFRSTFFLDMLGAIPLIGKRPLVGPSCSERCPPAALWQKSV
jgi:hypothetical protein